MDKFESRKSRHPYLVNPMIRLKSENYMVGRNVGDGRLWFEYSVGERQDLMDAANKAGVDVGSFAPGQELESAVLFTFLNENLDIQVAGIHGYMKEKGHTQQTNITKRKYR